jgi:hypothetical protein
VATKANEIFEPFDPYWKQRALKAEDRLQRARLALARQTHIRDRANRCDEAEAELKAVTERAEARKVTLMNIANGAEDAALLAQINLAVHPE